VAAGPTPPGPARAGGRRRPATLQALPEHLSGLLDELLAAIGPTENRDQVEAILATAVALALDRPARLDLKITNAALAEMTEADFVEVVTQGLGEPPAYFSEDVALNRSGHSSFDPSRPLEVLGAPEAVRRSELGALLLDVRDDQAFASGHLRGAVNVGLSGRFAEYAAAVHLPGQDVVLFGNPDQVGEARMRLARVGVDTVSAAVSDVSVLEAHPELVVASSRLVAVDAARRSSELAGLQVLDVRNHGELSVGAVPGSVHIPLPRLRHRLDELDASRPVLVYCAGGYRSLAASSLLASVGFVDASDVLGGFEAWQAAQRELAGSS
jgi:hydroxyacylglutathione hydrolase